MPPSQRQFLFLLDRAIESYVFGTAGNGHLFVHYWDGFNWYWADQQLPVGASVVYNPTAITYANGPQQALYVFATADNGHLVDSLRT